MKTQNNSASNGRRVKVSHQYANFITLFWIAAAALFPGLFCLNFSRPERKSFLTWNCLKNNETDGRKPKTNSVFKFYDYMNCIKWWNINRLCAIIWHKFQRNAFSGNRKSTLVRRFFPEIRSSWWMHNAKPKTKYKRLTERNAFNEY